MNLDLTKEQYRTLLKMVYLGDWMINSDLLFDEMETEYLDLKKYILSKGEEFGSGDMVEIDKKTGAVDLRNDIIMELYDQYVVPYDESVFWDNLSEEMAKKQLKEKYESSKTKQPSKEKFMDELYDLIDKYDNEFTDNGLNNLKMKL